MAGTDEETFRAAVAAELALVQSSIATAVIPSGGVIDVAAAIETAEAISKSWIIEIPVVGDVLEQLSNRPDVSVFHTDAVPGSLFATTEKLTAGNSRVLVEGGLIGSLAKGTQLESVPVTTVTKVLKTDEERFVLGIVLVPETADSQGDIYSHDEVRKAAHAYMEKARNLGTQHSEVVNEKLTILETYLAPGDFEMDGESVTKGTWLLGIRIVDDDLWTKTKKGEFTGFSIGGAALRTPEVS